jgi:hypothetical protein
MPRKAAARRHEEERTEASLPETIIPPSEAPASQRSAYWLELIDNPPEFRKAIASEEFFPMLREFPEAFWGNRLSLYLYRLTDDDGMMVRNAEGAAKYIKPVIRCAVDEDWIATRNGGGKFKLYLKLDSKESLREHTFRIDGPPKLQPGQVVDVDGKTVPIGQPVAAVATAEDRTDVARVIDASSKANESAMGILAHASETAIDMVKAQSVQNNRPDASSGIVEKLLGVMVDRMLQPPPAPPDPIESFIKLQGLINKNTPESEPPEKEGALTAGIDMVERLTGKSMSDILKPNRAAAETNEYGWIAPIANIGQQLVAQIPAIMHEARINRDIEFRRQVWLRTAQPGAAPPADLLANNPRLPATTEQPQTHTTQAPPTGQPDPAQLVPIIVQMICHGFDQNPKMGYQCAAAIDFNYGGQIEALALDKFLSNEAQVNEFVRGTPVLEQRSKDARWATFQGDFMDYTIERWGEDGGPEEVPARTDSERKQPQPAA